MIDRMDYDIRLGDLVRFRNPQLEDLGLGLVTGINEVNGYGAVHVTFASGLSDTWPPAIFSQSFHLVASGVATP